jgi:Rieske Fe-S protein
MARRLQSYELREHRGIGPDSDRPIPIRSPFIHMEEPTPATPSAAPDESADAAPIDRRGFLHWVSTVSAGITALAVGVPVVGAFMSPAFPKKSADDWIKVADDIALLDIGEPIRVNFVKTVEDAWIETRTLNGVWLYTEDGEQFKAYNAKCTHLGCGYVHDKERKNFFCPCHRGQFDIKTGAVLDGPPPRPLDELDVEVRDSAVYVKYKDFRLGVAERVEA